MDRLSATIEILKKEECCGCAACVAKCPISAIKMIKDKEGFFNPIIERNLCRNCGMCISVCPVLNHDKITLKKYNQACYAGFFKDKIKTKKCASGGAATALAETMIELNGIVFGTAYTMGFKSAEVVKCESREALNKLRSSKYIQGKKNNLYQCVEADLNEGKRILMIGLPCEIGALKSYLGKSYQNLYTCELICHGPTSDLVQKFYVEKLEKKYKSEVREFNIRYKKEGWTPFYIRAAFSNGKIFEKPFGNTDFGYAFSMFIRTSCYQCKFKGENRCADITIGDFWGDIKQEVFWNKDGVSAIMVHTEKGQELVRFIKEYNLYDVDYQLIRAGNPRLDECEQISNKRKWFSFLFVRSGLTISCILTRNIRKSIKNWIYKFSTLK